MTKEEAMEIITNALQSDESKYTEKIDKALALAQKALEREPCEDVVSKQAVEEIINDIRDYISVEGYWAILERMKKLPSITPQPKTGNWIPVSKRLPEEYEKVIVSDVFGVYIGQFVDAEENWGGKHFINEHGMHSKSVIAWMPLPDPYKAEGSES